MDGRAAAVVDDRLLTAAGVVVIIDIGGSGLLMLLPAVGCLAFTAWCNGLLVAIGYLDFEALLRLKLRARLDLLLTMPLCNLED